MPIKLSRSNFLKILSLEQLLLRIKLRVLQMVNVAPLIGTPLQQLLAMFLKQTTVQ